jgi:hypothetical protein
MPRGDYSEMVKCDYLIKTAGSNQGLPEVYPCSRA